LVSVLQFWILCARHVECHLALHIND